MLILQRMVFMLLLAGLQWTRCNGNTTDSASSLQSTASASTHTSESSWTAASNTASVVPSSDFTYHNTTSETTENDTQSTSITPHYTQTSQQQELSTEVSTQSSTHDNRTPFSSEIPTITSNLSGVSESAADTTHTEQSEAAPNSFSTTAYSVSFTTVASTGDIQTSVTALPNNITTTSNNAKTDLTSNVQTNSSTGTHETSKEDSNGGVIFGAIVGTVLGSALIGLVGYFICKKRKSEGFTHQRLYDDTGNDPVLRLDNVPESYGTSSADPSYYNPTTANETTVQNSHPPYDTIPMDDMTLTPRLP
uniref:mucin-15 n=1 Tax=Euleptes europaea TaxID=460621 RepID=UPI00253FD182|nr:mucin-15 [Euleptes europaea]